MPNGQGQAGALQLFAKANVNNGVVSWSLGTSNPPAPGLEPIDLPKDSGDRDIEFHLLPADIPITFDTADPIWVANGKNKCPPPSKGTDKQIEVVSCTDTVLTINDKNKGAACTLTYQLNFIGAKPLDPEIRNGGGKSLSIGAIGAVAIGAAALAVIALVVTR